MSADQAVEYALEDLEEPAAQPATRSATLVLPERIPADGGTDEPAETPPAQAKSTSAELSIFALGPARVERREELAREHQHALLSLGELLLDEGSHKRAAEVYRKAVSEDEYSEGAHRGLMRSYALLGERGRALKHYRSLEGVLGEGLGTAPAPETRQLYKELRQGEQGAS